MQKLPGFFSLSLLYPFNLSPGRLNVVVPEVKVITDPLLSFLSYSVPLKCVSCCCHMMMGDSLIVCPGVNRSLSAV